MTICNKCNKLAEYDSPDILCRFCWAKWWVFDGRRITIKNRDKLNKEYRNILSMIRKKYGTYKKIKGNENE